MLTGVAIAAAALAALSAIKGKGTSSMSSGKANFYGVKPYTYYDWAPIVSVLAPGFSLNPTFVMKWFEVESGFNPAAIGSPKAMYQGYPREIGLAQLYNPDDFDNLGISREKLRAYCMPPNTQILTRRLTDEEMNYAVKTAMMLIANCKVRAIKALQGAGCRWDEQSTYQMTKLVHALPGLVKGVSAVRAKLGRAPVDFEEFSANIYHVTLDAGTERYRSMWPRLLENAYKTGRVIPKRTVLS